MLKKVETCLYCAAPVQVPQDAGCVRCESCGRVMEVTRFTREERRLTEAVDEAKASAERAAEELKQCMNALGESQLEARRKAAEMDRACQETLKEVKSRLESSEARQMRSIYIQAENAQREGRFEDAENWYRKLLEHDDDEAEIHWRLVLCRYGVEYVCEQSSGRYLPTICHMVVDRVQENADYRAAVRCAGSEALRAHYEREARAIDAILEKYRQIRATEKPYDVFISVKQGDADGNPTKDSFTAQKLQYELQTRLGLHVFNSRSSLEGHAGTEFEPYIMAALMSAKVMVVVSSRPEYINAPWVRNEWRRFRWLKDNQSSERRLIVFLMGMSVRDVPAAMGDLQAISNTEAEPVKDLIRSIQEVFGGRRSRQEPSNPSNSSNLLELASIELEYGGFDKADEYCKQALYREPRNARAYALQLCAEKKVRAIEELSQLDQPLDDCVNYKKAVRFADDEFRQMLLKCNQAILDRASERIYETAADELSRIAQAQPESSEEAKRLTERCTELSQTFRRLKDYRDSADLERRCREEFDRLENAADQITYERAVEKLTHLEKASPKNNESAQKLADEADALAAVFQSIKNHGYSVQALKRCGELAERMRKFDPHAAQNAEKKAVRGELDRLSSCRPGTPEEANDLLKALTNLEERCTAEAGFTYEERVNLKSRIIDLRKRFQKVGQADINAAQDADKRAARRELDRLKESRPDTPEEANALLKSLADLEKRYATKASFTSDERASLKAEIMELRKRFQLAGKPDADAAKDAERKAVRGELDRLSGCRPGTPEEANDLLKALANLEERCTAEAGFTYEECVNLKSGIMNLRKQFQKAETELRNLKKRAEEAVGEFENRIITTRAEALQLNRDIAALKEEYDDFRKLSGGEDLLRRCDRLMVVADRYHPDSGRPTELEMQTARDALDAMESRRLVNGKQAQKLVGDIDALISQYNGFAGFPDQDELLNVRCAALRKRFSDIGEDIEKKRKARETVDEFEQRSVTNHAEALQLSGEIQQLMQAQDDFNAFSDGAKLRARCGDLLTRCTQYLSEGTGERQPPKFSAQEQRAFKDLAELEAQTPDTLGEIADLDERLRMLSSEHGNFWGYSEQSALKARVTVKRNAIAEDAAEIVDRLFRDIGRKPVSEAEAVVQREQLKQISSTCRDFELMPEAKRTAFRRRYRELLAQCSQPAKDGGDKPEKPKGFFAINWMGLCLLAAGGGLIGWALEEHGLSQIFVLSTFLITMIIVLVLEKLLCGKENFSSEARTGLKFGSTMLLTGLLYLVVSNLINLPEKFSAAPEHNFRNFLIAGAMCIYTLISTLEMFGKKKNGRGCIAAAMFVGFAYYFVWFIG